MMNLLKRTRPYHSAFMSVMFAVGLMFISGDAQAQDFKASSLLQSADGLLKVIGVLAGVYVLLHDLILPLIDKGKIIDSFGTLFVKFAICLILATGTLPAVLTKLMNN